MGHNAHGSLICVTDLNGYRTSMYVSTDYGAALHHKVVFDGQDQRISSLAHSTPSLGFTTITLSGTPLSTDELNGLELVISRPGSTGDRYITARVDDTTSSTIVVADVGGASAPVYAALNAQTQGFVVYDFHTGDNTTGGEWTDDPNHLPFLNVTRFTDENADFQSYMVGWTIIADVEKPSFLTIFAVPTATRVEVFGDATGLSADGQTYRLVAPPGVDPTTGALSKPNTVLSKRADNRGCMWLWSGFAQRTHPSNALRCEGKYVPPQVGHESGGSTTGAQGGINKLGTYYCWNRTYNVFMGRWTTPDPAATPFFDLFDYGALSPAKWTDPTGLRPDVGAKEEESEWKYKGGSTSSVTTHTYGRDAWALDTWKEGDKCYQLVEYVRWSETSTTFTGGMTRLITKKREAVLDEDAYGKAKTTFWVELGLIVGAGVVAHITGTLGAMASGPVGFFIMLGTLTADVLIIAAAINYAANHWPEESEFGKWGEWEEKEGPWVLLAEPRTEVSRSAATAKVVEEIECDCGMWHRDSLRGQAHGWKEDPSRIYDNAKWGDSWGMRRSKYESTKEDDVPQSLR